LSSRIGGIVKRSVRIGEANAVWSHPGGGVVWGSFPRLGGELPCLFKGEAVFGFLKENDARPEIVGLLVPEGQVEEEKLLDVPELSEPDHMEVGRR
jgi:hypothetical protein